MCTCVAELDTVSMAGNLVHLPIRRMNKMGLSERLDVSYPKRSANSSG